MRRHRKPPVKDVRCSVRLIVDGRTVKSIRRRIPLRQAVKGVAGYPFCTERRFGGVLVTRDGQGPAGMPWYCRANGAGTCHRNEPVRRRNAGSPEIPRLNRCVAHWAGELAVP